MISLRQRKSEYFFRKFLGAFTFWTWQRYQFVIQKIIENKQ